MVICPAYRDGRCPKCILANNHSIPHEHSVLCWSNSGTCNGIHDTNCAPYVEPVKLPESLFSFDE